MVKDVKFAKFSEIEQWFFQNKYGHGCYKMKKKNKKRQTNKTIFKHFNPYHQNLSNCFKNNNTNFMYIEIKKRFIHQTIM